MRPLDPAIQKVWLIKQALLWGTLLLAALGYEAFGLIAAARPTPPGLAAVVVLTLGLGFTLYLPRLRYRFWRFDLRKEELYLERGIFNRLHTIVPLRRIQHLDISQNLLERRYRLGKLIVHTAGTRSSEVVLPGLAYEEAERLRDLLKHYILEDAV